MPRSRYSVALVSVSDDAIANAVYPFRGDLDDRRETTAGALEVKPIHIVLSPAEVFGKQVRLKTEGVHSEGLRLHGIQYIFGKASDAREFAKKARNAYTNGIQILMGKDLE